ncbi:DUF7009 family protein [Fulvivirga lutea]|uniref:Uncharacterized protein n=1 Tax=Fulvivirga lutea TaxID=2810512 RepID=A0A974ZZF9_9BACT|nr:hypothetical protein [Fulvivirga lutea]QSE96051.1 hypothetical protein JR347_10530 [Fulvivirga lutea]
MKLRIQGNTLRLRLSKTEVDTFAQNGLVKEHTEFGDTSLTYLLESTDKKNVTATFEMNVIRIGVPESIKTQWTTTVQVGFDAIVKFGKQKLEVLVEKDFQCLVPRKEDESDLYVNPRA